MEGLTRARPQGVTLTKPALTFLPCAALPAQGQLVLYDLSSPTELGPLDAWCAGAGLAGGQAAEASLVLPGPAGPAAATVAVRRLGLARGLPALLALPHPGGPVHRRLPASAAVYAATARHAVQLVRSHRIIPTLVAGPDGVLHGVWRALSADDPVLARLAAALVPAGHAVARGPDEAWDAEALLAAFADAIADHLVRGAATSPQRPGRPRARLLPWTARWAEALADPADPSLPLRPGGAPDPAELLAGVTAWQRPLRADATGVVELRLVAPELQDDDWGLDLGIRSAAGGYHPAADVWEGGDAQRHSALLGGLGRAARVFEPLHAALAQAAPTSVALTLEQAWLLVTQTPLLGEAGIVVALPDGLRDSQRLQPRLRVGAPAGLSGEADGGDADLGDPTDPGWMATARTLARWEVALGDRSLSADEFDALARARTPLVRWDAGWVRVDPDDVARIAALAGTNGRGLTDPRRVTLAEALTLGLAGSVDGPDGEPVAVVTQGSVAVLLERIRDTRHRELVERTPLGFVGALRDYQRRGVAWLRGMGELGLGAVLADDMGLGKTVQLIAHLLERPGPALVVCPTSVVGNWERELARFGPGLQVTRHHGPRRPPDLAGVHGVVLTTYAILRRDHDLLARVDWDVVTLDEAQQVKNPSTQGARAIRRLPSRQTIALTGTPLENRLHELWSVLDATNPGLLGSRADFLRRYVGPVERAGDATTAARLRRLVAPFLLRREKADPTVIADLPPKLERTVACTLTPEQARLYQAAVVDHLPRLRDAGDALTRRGRVLALLTRLKQICNHPAQALGQIGPLPNRSGKLAATREIVREAVDGGDRLLVFTQYVVMGRLLVRQLSGDLDGEVPFLHGGLTVLARDRMVGEFSEGDTAPVLVVSLRAGGTGLNLAAATHVVHYDRWWNPAVEDQATDRVHRIGQTRRVQVHKLVTAGTLEERIDVLLADKRRLARSFVGAGETWLGGLDDAELAELVTLSRDATVAELDEDVELDPRPVGIR